MTSGLLKAVDLNSVGGGAAPELFQRELERIAENISDQNTRADAARKITLTFTFKPDSERRETVVLVEAKAALAPVTPARNTVYCGKIDGKSILIGHDPNQLELDTTSEGVPTLQKKVRMPYAD